MRTIKSLPEMETDMLQELATGSEKKRRIYKTESEEFKKEMLATDMETAVATIKNTARVKVDFKDPEDVKQRITDYFTACAHTGRFPSIQGLASYGFGISRQALNQWRLRKENAYTESARLIDIASDMIADTLTNQSLHNNANAIMSLFQLKNNHSFADRVEVQSVQYDDDEYRHSNDNWKERYRLLIDEVERSETYDPDDE